MNKRELPSGWEKALPTFPASATGISTRDASGKVLNALAEKIPWLLGGAADLYPSTKTRLTFEFAGDFQPKGALGDYKGRNFHFGIREHAMCAIVNGMVLTGLRAFGSGFLIFTDYARGAIRLSSLMDHSGAPHLDPRHNQPGRGRAYSSTDRATGVAARDTGHGRPPSRGCQRDGRGLSRGYVVKGPSV